ncbi:MAG: hypothetical protein AAF487_09415 [Bacteroidota bacterium]
MKILIYLFKVSVSILLISCSNTKNNIPSQNSKAHFLGSWLLCCPYDRVYSSDTLTLYRDDALCAIIEKNKWVFDKKDNSLQYYYSSDQFYGRLSAYAKKDKWSISGDTLKIAGIHPFLDKYRIIELNLGKMSLLRIK